MFAQFLYVNYPSWIHPEVFPNVKFLGLIRWYGLMYVVAFALAYYILKRQWKEGSLDVAGESKVTEDDLMGFIFTGIIFLVIGARIFATLVYDTSKIYWKKPWLIFWPFDSSTHKFTGLAGMSYHGGFIGGLIGMIVWCMRHKKPLWKWIDAMCVSIPLGYTFGRIGNFMNGELYGRITTMPWGMIFPQAGRFESFSVSLDWVQEFMAKIGMTVAEGQKIVNLPRHPSQLYEAFFEGLALFCLLWCVRKKKPFDGFLGALYTICYGTVRFVIEYFRQPDWDKGFRFSANGSTELYHNTSLLNISTGQVLCMGMILGGIALMAVLAVMDRKKKKKSE